MEQDALAPCSRPGLQALARWPRSRTAPLALAWPGRRCSGSLCSPRMVLVGFIIDARNCHLLQSLIYGLHRVQAVTKIGRLVWLSTLEKGA